METALKTQSYYLRGKHTLLLRADLSNFLIDYYLTLKKNRAVIEQEHDEQLKQLMAGLAMHLTSRPPDESVAWTLLMHGQRPYSLFVTGSVSEQAIVGQVLYDKIRHTDVNIFNQQTIRPGYPPFQSAVRSEASDIKGMLEDFYAQSEQLPLKISYPADSDLSCALIAMPGFEQDWFKCVDAAAISQSLADYEHKQTRSCSFNFTCGCSLDKLLPFFKAIPTAQLEELYGDDPVLIVNCPRCGKTFEVSREIIVARP